MTAKLPHRIGSHVRQIMPYIGGKTFAADTIWAKLGNVSRLIVPFFGSGAEVLNRPHALAHTQTEVVNDRDGYLINLWRAIQHAPHELAERTRTVRSGVDMVAYSRLLQRNQDALEALQDDIDFYDVKMALAYLYVMTLRIGSSSVLSYNRPKFFHSGAVNGVWTLPYNDRIQYFEWLSERLMRVTIHCHDWQVIMDSKATIGLHGKGHGWANTIGIILDPPYTHHSRTKRLYRIDDNIAPQVREVAIHYGAIENLRVVLCGLDGEHDKFMPADWVKIGWQGKNGFRKSQKAGEIMWFSPYCLKDQARLFD